MKNDLNILFFEPEIKGHQIDYISYLCDFYLENSFNFNISFLVNTQFYKELEIRNKNKDFTAYNKYGIHFIELTKQESNACLKSNLLLSSINKWMISNKYCNCPFCNSISKLENVENFYEIFRCTKCNLLFVIGFFGYRISVGIRRSYFLFIQQEYHWPQYIHLHYYFG